MAVFHPVVVFFNKYKYHFLFWSIYIAYEMIMVWQGGFILYSYKEYVFAYIISLLLFYFHANVLLKYTLNSNIKLLRYSLPLLILLEFFAYCIIKLLIEIHIYKQIGVQNPALDIHDGIYYYRRVWRFFLFIAIATGYYFLQQHQEQRQRVERMKQEELKKILWEKEIKNELTLTQNAILRAQINPHFLINTLSYLYNETWKIEPEAAENILSLSEIMQYALNKDVSSPYVKLENEIKLIKNFLSLYQVRQLYKMQLKLVYTSEVLSVLFIPLIMMALTETILQNSQLDDPLKPAEIRIVHAYSILSIETTSFEGPEKRGDRDETIFTNINNRLLLAYGEKASFNYHLDSSNYFHTAIRVQF
ncbi:histidine kinase [Pedobacter cryoconitis]|uniref:Histidine kinase n=1 Tax=Pedobacter cryoconitis TaxID=188932 RepID=A0A327T2Y5_9SPHI|nr:sensor histidine kinase [Pedobacter cryoconitis]RAJ34414.1 histidine kinase [Pedobacter cryoconitis]